MATMSTKRPRSESETAVEKTKRHCSEGASNSVSSGTASTSDISTGERQLSNDQGSTNSSPSRESARIPAMPTSPDNVNVCKTSPFEENGSNKIKVHPHEFVCLYQYMGNLEMPLYVKQGKTDSPVMRIVSHLGKMEPDVLKKSFSDEQIKRMNCISDCIEALLKGLKCNRQEKIWFDTTSDLNARKTKCRSIIQKYGLCPEKVFIDQALEMVYKALLVEFDNGAAKKAMKYIFAISHMLLKGNARDITLIDTFGRSSELIDANTRLIKVIRDVGSFDWRIKNKIIEELMCAEEIQNAVPNWVTPDVAMCINEDLKEKYYLFGECKLDTFLVSPQFQGQIFRQCLRGLQDFDRVYGCGLTYEGYSLIEIESDQDIMNVTFDYSSFHTLRDTTEPFFDCNALLNFIIWTSHKITLYENL